MNALISRRLNLLFFLFLLTSSLSSAQEFVRLNSGTKENIKDIAMFENGEGYFLTTRLYSLHGIERKKMNLPSFRQISFMSALSLDNIWYSADMVNNTPIVYHKHDDMVESIQLPFGVIISAMYVAPDNTAFFSSFSEVSVYKNYTFSPPRLTPTSNTILKIVGYDENLYWILTDKNELYKYDGKNYSRVLPDKKIIDFQPTGKTAMLLLCDKEIVELSNGLSRTILVDERLRRVDKMFISPTGDLWMIGAKCKILTMKNGRLFDFSVKGDQLLTCLSFAGKKDIWIAGSEGMLLYKGDKIFPRFTDSEPGFMSFRLTNYGVDMDNEYGVALADFDGDDKTDIYSVCISDVNRMFINQIDHLKGPVGAESFTEESLKRNGEGASEKKLDTHLAELKLGISVVDVDNDGDQDIYLCYLNTNNRLLLNDGHGNFRNVVDQANRACEDVKRCTAAVFSDINLDGSLDVFVTSEDGTNRLYLNDGTGHFTDVTAQAGLLSGARGSCAAFGDINDDGYPDLCVTFWNAPNKLYLNDSKNGEIRFRDITSLTDLWETAPCKSNGVTFVDVNNDGYLDLFIANRNAVNKLYLNDGNGIFKDATDRYFEKNIFLTNGAVFADFDLDGYQDLYITNVGENVLYKNMHGNSFKDVTMEFGAELSGYGTGCAVGDLDGDGKPDLYAANYIGGSSKAFINLTGDKNTVVFKLEGYLSNRDAVGAKIYLYAKSLLSGKDSLAGRRDISGGGGYASISAKEAIFPIDPGKKYFAVVKFPFRGSEMRIEDIEPGRLVIKEQSGLKALVTRTEKSMKRVFKDPEIQREVLKVVAILFILLFYIRKYIYGDRLIVCIRLGAVLTMAAGYLILHQLFMYTSSVALSVVPIVVSVILLVIIHLITERMQVAKTIARHRIQLREKISRDLHDDLASTLGSISIYSDNLKRMDEPGRSEFKKLSLKIADLTQSALQSITDIIWMTSPRNDSLQGLLSKANNLLYETFTESGIQYQADINMPDKEITLSDELRSDLFLILKEATYNIVRHAGAASVTLLADVTGRICSISLMDDGVGFDEKKLRQQVSHGNGLINIRRRAVESKIDLSIHSSEGKGTVINLIFKI